VDTIWVIAADWQFRAMVLAQLLEEGYQVRAMPSPQMALAALLRGEEPPHLLIVDTHDGKIEPRVLHDLWQAAGQAALILCGSAQHRAALHQEDLPARLMLRPFRVADLVREVREALAEAQDNSPP
jgi:DNA-binding response OmpR family regulator